MGIRDCQAVQPTKLQRGRVAMLALADGGALANRFPRLRGLARVRGWGDGQDDVVAGIPGGEPVRPAVPGSGGRDAEHATAFADDDPRLVHLDSLDAYLWAGEVARVDRPLHGGGSPPPVAVWATPLSLRLPVARYQALGASLLRFSHARIMPVGHSHWRYSWISSVR